jgi:hypothetical protein
MKKIISLVLISLVSTIGCAVETTEMDSVEEKEQAVVGGLQINEVAVSGTRFVEIFNGGTTAVNLGNYRVASGRSDSGPDLGQSCSLSGSLAAGQYRQVRSSCSGVSNCTTCSVIQYADPDYNFNPLTGVETGPVNRTFYLLNSSNNSVFEMVTYPNHDGSPVQSCTCVTRFGQVTCDESVPVIGQSWSAVPNGGDCFRVASRTPGSSN